MIGTRVGLVAVAGALALPMSLLSAASAATNPGAAAGDAVVAVGRQDSGPPVRIIHSANSTGATDHVQLVASGMNSTDVAVIFPGIGGPGGTVTLSTVGGTQPPACSPLRWSAVKADEHVVLRCNTNALQPATVHVSFTRAKQPTGSFAYAFANQPTTRSYVPDQSHQYSTSGKRMTVTRIARGQYQVRVPHVQTAHGVVQVTAVGPQLADLPGPVVEGNDHGRRQRPVGPGQLRAAVVGMAGQRFHPDLLRGAEPARHAGGHQRLGLRDGARGHV